jgi:hypothetical protein
LSGRKKYGAAPFCQLARLSNGKKSFSMKGKERRWEVAYLGEV